MAKLPSKSIAVLYMIFFVFTGSTHTVGGNALYSVTHAPGSLQASPGDEMESAIVVNTFPFTDSRPAYTATENDEDPILECDTYANQHTIWYLLSVPTPGRVEINTFESRYNTVLGIFTESENSLESVACNNDAYEDLYDNARAGFTSRIEFDALPEQNYYILIATKELLNETWGILNISIIFTSIIPHKPTPVHENDAVPSLQNLAWWGLSNNSTPITYTIAFGTVDPPPIVDTVIQPLCRASEGAGGLTPGIYDTTVAGRPALVIVGENYNAQTPSHLAFYLHGDKGVYDGYWEENGMADLINERGWVFVAPQAPQTDFGEQPYWQWYANPRGNVELLASVFEEMFAKYNLCRNSLLGASASGGSVFYSRYFFPYRGDSYPAHIILHCGGGFSDGIPYFDEEIQTLYALGRNPDIVSHTELKFMYGSEDFLAEQARTTAQIYQSAGFSVISDELREEEHCTYDSWQESIKYFRGFRETETVYGYSPEELAPNTTYYWQITAMQGSDEYVGPIWQFTTDAAYLPAPSPGLSIDNFTSGETVRYDLPLLKGTIPDSNAVTITSAGTTLTWSVHNGRWRAFVPLEIGENTILLETDKGNQTTLVLNYHPQENTNMVRLAYPRGLDSSGAFDAPIGESNSLENALPRIRLAGRMLQSIIAELFYEKGLERQTFNLLRDENHEPVVATPISPLTVSELQSMEWGDLWLHYYDILNDLPNSEEIIDIVIPANSYHDIGPDVSAARVNLASGGLILLNENTLYSYAETLEEIENHFTDSSSVEPYLPAEYTRVPEYWATYAGSLGLILHTMGYHFGLSQPDDPTMADIMHQGLYYLNRMAVTYEPGFGDINPATDIMPRWTDTDITILQHNEWFSSESSSRPAEHATYLPTILVNTR